MVQALGDLLESPCFNDNSLTDFLSSFSSIIDDDASNFLKNNAINFEKQRLTKTFFDFKR